MRILGADSFGGKDTSINAIPVNYLVHGDACMVMIGADDPMYDSAVYYYEYITNFGGEEDIPRIIVPLDNYDTNIQTGSTGDNGARWVLRNIYAEKIMAGSLVTDTISPPVSGSQIFIGDDLTVGDNGIIVDGQVQINSSIYDPPLIVNSDVMVENLNAEFLGGKTFEGFVKNDNNQIFIPQDVDVLDVYLSKPMTAPPHYSVMIDICNVVDDNPAIYSFMIINKESDHFTVRFSGIIDSPNYVLHYFVLGDAESDIPSPSGGPAPSGV